MSQAPDQKTPIVSVVIPTNNRKEWVTEALESVFAQTYQNFEVIVVDDGSKDGTSEHLREHYGERIRLFRTEGTNCPTAKNFGTSHALGKYIGFLDDDDLWYPQKLEKQVAYLEAAPDHVAMVGSGCDHIDRDGNPFWKPNIPENRLDYRTACIEPRLPGASSGSLIKKSVFDEFNGFDLSLTRNQDRDLWIKLTRKYEVHLIPEVLSTVRVHGGERRGITIDLIRDCRLTINSRIPEAGIRRQANAWTHFHLFNLYWRCSRRKSLFHLVLSFLIYPLPLPVDRNRTKVVIKKFLNR